MANSKLTALTEFTGPFTGDEQFYVVEDDDGTPVSRRVTIETMYAAFDPLGLYWRPSGTNSDDDEFNDGSIAGAFTQVTPTGAVSWSEARHGLLGKVTSSMTSGDLAAIVKPMTIAVGECVETALGFINEDGNYTSANLVMTDGTANTSNVIGIGIYHGSTVGSCALWTFNGTLTAYTQVTGNSMFSLGRQLFARIRRSASTTYVPEVSVDGSSWVSFSLTNITSAVTFTHAGLAVANFAGASIAGQSRFEYIRHT